MRVGHDYPEHLDDRECLGIAEARVEKLQAELGRVREAIETELAIQLGQAPEQMEEVKAALLRRIQGGEK